MKTECIQNATVWIVYYQMKSLSKMKWKMWKKCEKWNVKKFEKMWKMKCEKVWKNVKNVKKWNVEKGEKMWKMWKNEMWKNVKKCEKCENWNVKKCEKMWKMWKMKWKMKMNEKCLFKISNLSLFCFADLKLFTWMNTFTFCYLIVGKVEQRNYPWGLRQPTF